MKYRKFKSILEFMPFSKIAEENCAFHFVNKELAKAIDKAAVNLKTKLKIAAAL